MKGCKGGGGVLDSLPYVLVFFTAKLKKSCTRTAKLLDVFIGSLTTIIQTKCARFHTKNRSECRCFGSFLKTNALDFSKTKGNKTINFELWKNETSIYMIFNKNNFFYFFFEVSFMFLRFDF